MRTGSGSPHPAPPASAARVSVGGDPLVYAYYPGHGLQFQPLFNWTKVNGYWFDKDYTGMQQMIDQLAPHEPCRNTAAGCPGSTRSTTRARARRG